MQHSDFPWSRLQAHAASMPALQSLADDAPRGEQLRFDFAGLHLDLSRARIDIELLQLAIEGLQASGLQADRQALFEGELINDSELRPALHPLLRASTPTHERLAPMHAEIVAARSRMLQITEALRGGRGSEVGLIDARAVVNLGIGGSDLGPRLVCEALGDDRLPVHFVANVDGHAFARLAPRLPRETLFVVTSKSFSTRETLLNADSARQWLKGQGVADAELSRHFVVCTARPDRAERFGAAAMLPFAEGVGGRYSLWSTVGFAIAVALGATGFQDLLAGAEAMDQHFLQAPAARNLPVLLGLVHALDRALWHCPTRAVVPYDERLALLPAFLQQLEMESNGKGVDRRQQPLGIGVAPVVWGGVGTDGQHAYFQSLHQGVDVVPVDFLAPIRPDHALREHHNVLLANLLAQSAALCQGQELPPEDPLRAARACPGGRPSTVLLLDQLDAHSLGALLALYEHKVFVQSVVAGINPFDQWGVELGKAIASQIEPALAGDGEQRFDPTTESLLRRIRSVRADSAIQ
ncbi:MAG: glucose-6-phosphate isomerase [Lysobacterales bacterium]